MIACKVILITYAALYRLLLPMTEPTGVLWRIRAAAIPDLIVENVTKVRNKSYRTLKSQRISNSC